jgi:formylglycine-generating enzyme required for sulfatase activity
MAVLLLGGLYVLDFPLPRIPGPTPPKPGASEPQKPSPALPRVPPVPPVPPSGETAKPEAPGKAVEATEARLLADISRATDRAMLLDIAARHPAQSAAVEGRLSALGFVRVARKEGAIWLMPGAGEAFRDCVQCPEMVLLPAGRYRMGSPAAEDGRAEDEDDTPGPGGAPVDAVVERPFAVGRFEVTRGEFAAFVGATGHKADGGCYQRRGGRTLDAALSWQSPGFAQDDRHPVTCVSHEDARAFLAWLSERTGQPYRLLSEAEWEFAARAAASGTRFSFGEDVADLCRHANGADLTAKAENPGWETADCRDGFAHTAPIGSFRPNGAGLHDMHGNLWEWVADCASGDLKAAARGPHVDCGGGDPRVLRGGSWSDPPRRLRSAARVAGPPATRDQIAGFRVARSIRP